MLKVATIQHPKTSSEAQVRQLHTARLKQLDSRSFHNTNKLSQSRSPSPLPIDAPVEPVVTIPGKPVSMLRVTCALHIHMIALHEQAAARLIHLFSCLCK